MLEPYGRNLGSCSFPASASMLAGVTNKRIAQMRGLRIVLAATLALAGCTSASKRETPAALTYQLVQSIPLGAPDRWDSVVFDPTYKRVYVAHGDRVTVIDSSTGALVGHVEGFGGGTHGIAVSTATGSGYTDDGK